MSVGRERGEHEPQLILASIELFKEIRKKPKRKWKWFEELRHERETRKRKRHQYRIV